MIILWTRCTCQRVYNYINISTLPTYGRNNGCIILIHSDLDLLYFHSPSFDVLVAGEVDSPRTSEPSWWRWNFCRVWRIRGTRLFRIRHAEAEGWKRLLCFPKLSIHFVTAFGKQKYFYVSIYWFSGWFGVEVGHIYKELRRVQLKLGLVVLSFQYHLDHSAGSSHCG